MKKIIFSVFALLSILANTSCENDDPTAILSGEVTPSELQPVSGNNFVLLLENAAQEFETFEWTQTDYGFKASVNYVVQMDVEGNNFATPFELVTTRSTSASVTVGKINDGLLALGLTPEQAADVEVRIVSNVGSNVETAYSNTQLFTITPYATSFPPIWAMGAALNGWGPWNDKEVELQSTEFKKYQTVARFINGEIFRFFAQQDWGPTSYNYNYFTTVDSDLALNPADGDNNFKVLGATGYYLVKVNLTAKTVEMEPVAEPLMYMTGAGVGGWDQPGTGNSVKMTYVKPGVFTAETEFISNETFRFFAQADWGPTSYNFPYFAEGTVDPLFENADDGDKNFRYLGTTGVQKITVDINAKTVTVGDPPIPVLFITGDDFGWGWSEGSYEELTYNSGPGTFTITTTLTNNNLFRFFPQKDWSPSYTFEYFTTVDSELEDQGPGDHNFRYMGTTGSKTITVNLTTKVVTVD